MLDLFDPFRCVGCKILCFDIPKFNPYWFWLYSIWDVRKSQCKFMRSSRHTQRRWMVRIELTVLICQDTLYACCICMGGIHLISAWFYSLHIDKVTFWRKKTERIQDFPKQFWFVGMKRSFFSEEIQVDFYLLVLFFEPFFYYLRWAEYFWINQSVQRVIQITSIESLSRRGKNVARANTKKSNTRETFLSINLRPCVQLTYWFGTEALNKRHKKNLEIEREREKYPHSIIACEHAYIHMNLHDGWDAIITLFPHLGALGEYLTTLHPVKNEVK